MEEIKTVIVLVLIICTISCNVKSEVRHQSSSAIKIAKENVDCLSFPRNALSYDRHYKFLYKGDSSQVGTKYRIVWGIRNSIRRQSGYEFEVQGNGTMGYLSSNDSVVILSQSCGTSCTFFAILPFSGRKPLLYYHPEAIDLYRNLIAYSPVEYVDSVFLIVENYLTGQKVFLKEDNLCPAIFKGDCIECCYFDGIDLVLKWQGSKWKNWDNPDLQYKRIAIEFD